MAKVLIACEESQVVTKAFRERGVKAYSCDLQSCSGGYPNWHIKRDVREIINDDWDAIIAFPNCDHLAVSGARWFKEKRADGRQQKAIEFFMMFTNLKCKKVVIENPVGIMSTHYRKPDQIIHPWQFGHGETKKTCLWIKGLPLLVPTNIVGGREQRIWKMPPGPDRAKMRSRTYEGIGAGMADQWSRYILGEKL